MRWFLISEIHIQEHKYLNIALGSLVGWGNFYLHQQLQLFLGQTVTAITQQRKAFISVDCPKVAFQCCFKFHSLAFQRLNGTCMAITEQLSGVCSRIGSGASTQVIRLVHKVLLPTELLCWPTKNTYKYLIVPFKCLNICSFTSDAYVSETLTFINTATEFLYSINKYSTSLLILRMLSTGIIPLGFEWAFKKESY